MKRAKKSFFLASGLGVSAALAQIFSVAFSLSPATLSAIPGGGSVQTPINETQTLEVYRSAGIAGDDGPPETADEFQSQILGTGPLPTGAPSLRTLNDATIGAAAVDDLDQVPDPIDQSTWDAISALYP